MKMFYHEILK